MFSIFVRVVPYIIIYFLIETLLRVSLFVRSAFSIDYSFLDIIKVLITGAFSDFVTLVFFLIPVVIYNLLLPNKLYGNLFDKIINTLICFVFTFVLLFDSVAEHIFWSEFNTRFNFIAVDYLVYTHEVIGNIIESFPIYQLISAIALIACILTSIFFYYFPFQYNSNLSFRGKFKHCSILLILLFLPYVLYHHEEKINSDNAEAIEVASNGVYNLFYAFWNNEINYEKFYLMQPENRVYQNIKKLLAPCNKDIQYEDQEGNLTRVVRSPLPEKYHNVIIVVMESMGAEYMAAFGNDEDLTPNLDNFSSEGLLFTSLYATGTRTVRGLEAITLSLPPTPGQSIVRRIGNDNLFSLGFLFKERGYDTKFIYGGFGYFDNMNAFFASNGFDIVDRTDMKNDEIQFSNVWGVCDEDLFKRAIVEADKSYQKNNKFMQVVMTTSNHRPFTFPEGKIDLPSRSGRKGGVKYADYSVGELIKSAKEKPWFDDTIFVFVADHTAGAGGKVELNLAKYHIPLIFYAPNIIPSGKYNDLASQIDIAPTLLGILNFSYNSKFFGRDLLNDSPEHPRAFISNYQKVALIEKGAITVLAPKSKFVQYSWPEGEILSEINQELLDNTVAYYQSASKWRKNHKL